MNYYKLQENEKVLTIFLLGKIDECSDYSTIKTDYDEIIVDFNDVTSINSCGIREWINFLLTLKDKKITYKNCPKIIVDQMSSVNEFLPQNAKVESIYLPYYCEDCDLEGSELRKIKDIYQDNKIIIPEKKCTECEKEMEFDEIADVYFLFLKTKKV